jgi:CDP-diacylglycerol--glycerol-3-phosphate 3-phosphatidyltransferase
MNLPNRLTFLRVILTPVFFIVYFLPKQFPATFAENVVWPVLLLWVIFIVAEISDLLDGLIARRMNQTSDFGKLFDPFADTLMQITCFFCFVLDGIFPAVLLLLVVYRELGILFVRNLMLRKGIALGARIWGKIKTVTHIIAAAIALLYVSLSRLDLFLFLQPFIRITAIGIFVVSVFFSILSFFDYVRVYRALSKDTQKT